MNSRQFPPIEWLVSPGERKKSPITAEHRSDAIPGVGEQTLAAEEPAELFRPRIAGDAMAQFLEPGAISARKYNAPPVHSV